MRAPILDQPSISVARSEEHTSELQSQSNLVCRLLLEKKNSLRPLLALLLPADRLLVFSPVQPCGVQLRQSLVPLICVCRRVPSLSSVHGLRSSPVPPY